MLWMTIVRFRFFIVIATLLSVSACKMTSGQLTKFTQPCEPLPIQEASVNWAVFGTVVKAENCPGRGHYHEKYKLANGSGTYQEVNTDMGYFNEVSERVFREWIKGIKVFANEAETIKLHFPKIKNHPTIFAHIQAPSGRQYIAFQMSAGFPFETYGWTKNNSGILYDKTMSEDDFRQYFLERLRVFDTSAAANFILSARKTDVPTQGLELGESNKVICRRALATGIPLRWDEGTYSKKSVSEAQRRSFSPESCAELVGRVDDKYAVAKLTDKEVCKAATTYNFNYNSERWRTGPASEAYRQEAIQRGLGLKDCLALAKPSSPSTTTKASQPQNNGKIEKRLWKLKKLVDDGLITPDEAAAKRKEILNSL